MSHGITHEGSKSKHELEFLTATDLAQFRDPQIKKKVRSHIQRGRQWNRKHGDNNRKGEFILDISMISPVGFDAATQAREMRRIALSVPHPSDLGSGRSDPFRRYPIAMSLRTHELFDHLQGKDCSMFKTLNRIGFLQLVQHEAAFRQILYTSSADIARLRNVNEEDFEGASLSGKAIQSLKKLVADPVSCIGDEIIISVLAFACHSVLFKDSQGILAHFQGLEAIIKRREGIQGVGYSQVLRTMIFWLDVNAAFLLDRSPRFPIPSDILPALDAGLPDLSAASPLTRMRGSAIFNSSIADLMSLSQFIIKEVSVRALWDDGVFAGLYVVPVISKFLSIPHNIIDQDLAFLRQETCRLGAILYLAGIRQGFGIELHLDIYVSKLKLILAIPSQDHGVLLSLWLLVLGGLQSFLSEHHGWFVSATADLIMRLQYSFWDEVIAALNRVVWIEGLLGAGCEEFRMEITSTLWDSFEYWLH